MNFPEEQLGRVGQKFSDIGRKIEYGREGVIGQQVAVVEQHRSGNAKDERLDDVPSFFLRFTV